MASTQELQIQKKRELENKRDHDPGSRICPGGAQRTCLEKPEPRRFPPPWTIEDIDAAFIVKDGAGQKLAYVYYEEESGRRSAAKMLSRDEARRIAANIAKRRRCCGSHRCGIPRPSPCLLWGIGFATTTVRESAEAPQSTPVAGLISDSERRHFCVFRKRCACTISRATLIIALACSAMRRNSDSEAYGEHR